jgi:cytochrome c peroxidase
MSTVHLDPGAGSVLARVGSVLALLGLLAGGKALAQLPPPPVPAGNPLTPEKIVLGKMLFWDEQLSSDNTVACGTCHRPELGGSDPRLVPTPGRDGIPGTPDDPFGSPGVIHSDASNDYAPDPLHDFRPRVTTRNAPSFIGAQYFTDLFWDGRAPSTFVDPVTGTVSLAIGGALESQCVGPPTSDVEMAHEARSWTQVTSKLTGVEPLKLATSLPPDIQTALAINPTYPLLFDAAFGTPDITAERIAFAIASYERILIPDRTPFDRFSMGDTTALTPAQQAGLGIFLSRNCAVCHTPPFFSDDRFHNIGLRPVVEDRGLQGTTGLIPDRGKFKTPGLRNVGLRVRFMHNGRFTTLLQVVNFYNGGGVFPDNRDPIIRPLGLGPVQRNQLVDFLENGLTDPRVAAALPPFDRPTLHSELATPNPLVYGASSPGTGGLEPLMIATVPPNLANPDFRLGIGHGLGGATAHLFISANPAATTTSGGIPLNVDLSTSRRHRILSLAGVGAGQGFATFHVSIPDLPGLAGRTLYAQWFVQDASATGGFAASLGAELTLF